MGSDATAPRVAPRVVVGPVIFPAHPAMIARLATIVPNATRNRSVIRIFRDETRSERWTGFPESVLSGEPAIKQRVGDSLLVSLPMLAAGPDESSGTLPRARPRGGSRAPAPRGSRFTTIARLVLQPATRKRPRPQE
jgi:hypothetical protein